MVLKSRILLVVAALLLLYATGCGQPNDKSSGRTPVTALPAGQGESQAELIDPTPEDLGIGETGGWSLYQDEDTFTDELEHGALLAADNGFQLEVECGRNGFSVRLDVNTIFFGGWDGDRSWQEFDVRVGGGPIQVMEWYVAPDEEWIGGDNEEWLVSPDPVRFTEQLISSDGTELLVRHGDDEDTGKFDLTGTASALPPVLGACQTDGYLDQPDVAEVVAAAEQAAIDRLPETLEGILELSC